jgi:ribonucleotide monophosphatase NagD (HAD superfamily)
VAQAYEDIGGQVVQAGKPHAAIYGRALEIVDATVGRPVPRARILAIGDGIGTDILGASRQGLDSVFVASGMHGDALLRGSGVDEGRVTEALAEESVSATYVIPRLA